MMSSIAESLGATYPAGTSQIVLFIPDRDKEGGVIDQRFWQDEALKTLGMLFRGAPAFPPGRGVWRDDTAGGAMLFEQTVMVVSYTDPVLLTSETLTKLREFLHRFGREARQGEVGIVMDGVYYGISRYDTPESLTSEGGTHESSC
jgi:hypothetical protein